MSQYKVRKLHLRPMPRRQSLISSQSFVVVVNHEFWSQSHLKCRCHRSSRFFCPWDKLTKVFHDGSCKPKKHHLQLHNDFMVLLHELLLTASRKRISKRTNTPNRSFPNMIIWSKISTNHLRTPSGLARQTHLIRLLTFQDLQHGAGKIVHQPPCPQSSSGPRAPNSIHWKF